MSWARWPAVRDCFSCDPRSWLSRSVCLYSCPRFWCEFALQFHRLPHPLHDVFQLRHYRHQQIIRHGHEPRLLPPCPLGLLCGPAALWNREHDPNDLEMPYDHSMAILRSHEIIAGKRTDMDPEIRLSRSGRGRFNAVPSHQAAAGVGDRGPRKFKW